LAQKIDDFFCSSGPRAAADMARDRRETWFDPELVDAFLSFSEDENFWNRLASDDPRSLAVSLEPEGFVRMANDAMVDRIARAFAQVVDAKSPWTFRHSEGVARNAVGIANVLGLSENAVSGVYRAGLLHDIGKLGVSNLILDKPGNLTSDQYVELRQHPKFTHEILNRIPAFQNIAEAAASHHERLDGRGYHRGLRAADLPVEARLLVVSDIAEALSAKRPYRDSMPYEKVHEILAKDAGTAVCPECVEALKTYQERADLISRVNDQLSELETVLSNL
ncbi:MAG TPA: HD domain-containing phosphohydrolase, partial [Planctomycetaceae bacterium]|nr:HD domain-containing phosphohydrolase [Planctomycetaceae bacterium]